MEVSKLAKKYKVFKKSCILLFLQEHIKNMGKGDKKQNVEKFIRALLAREDQELKKGKVLKVRSV